MGKDLVSRVKDNPTGTRFNVVGLPSPVGHYKHVTAVRVGSPNDVLQYDLYIAGMLAWDSNGKIVGESDIYKQTEQVLANIAAAIVAASDYLCQHRIGRSDALEYIVDTEVKIANVGELTHNLVQVNKAFSDCKMPKVSRSAAAYAELPLQKGKGALVMVKAHAVLPYQLFHGAPVA